MKMLKSMSVKEKSLNFPKNAISQKSKKDIINPKKNEEKEEENYDSDISQTNKTSPTSPTNSNYDSTNESNQEKFNDISNSFTEEKDALSSTKDINKNVFPTIDYFLCNEKYFQEKMPEKSDYKRKSKNFIKKTNFNNKMQIENIDLNRVNTILEDIENSQKNNNNYIKNVNINKFDVNINFVDNNELNLNQLSNANITAFDLNNNFYLSQQINTINFNFESKYIYLLFNFL